MGLSETSLTWACVSCGRKVPTRIENCRCGAMRPPTSTPAVAARVVTQRDIPRTPALMEAVSAAGPSFEATATAPPLAIATTAPTRPASAHRDTFDEELRYPAERTRFRILFAFSLLFWVGLTITIVGIFYALAFLLFSLIGRALFLANLRGNALVVSEHQLPHIHNAVVRAAARLGLRELPQVFVTESGGVLNAFATHLFSRKYVIVNSALIDACQDQRQVDFVVAHEVGHLAAGHLKWMGFLAPGHLLPWVGMAYSRACEYTCDRCGLAVIEDLDAADRGLLVLAAGSKAAAAADVTSFLSQRFDTGAFFPAVLELGSTHPYLCKRVAALREFQEPGSMAPVARNPFAYLFAPLATFGGATGGLPSLLISVMMIGIIAAIAIPSLLRARVAANEAATINHAREVVSAETAFQSASGRYATFDCLKAPARCVSGYPANGPVFLSGPSAEATASGYTREIIHADGLGFAYVAVPVVQNQTGVRVFCADARGVVCAASSVEEATMGTMCAPTCRPIL